MDKIETIYFIGGGGVFFALAEIFKKEKLYSHCAFTIIEPLDINDLEYVMKGRKYRHIKQSMTRENYKELLKDIDSKTFIINVSVCVDSLDVLRFAGDKGSWYIDTSIEQYQDTIHVPVNEITKYSQFKSNNLYHQQLLAEKIMKKTRKTRLTSGGMNPGLISQYFKKSLAVYGKNKGKSLVNGDYAKLAHELGLVSALVVEYDSQKLRVKATPDLFVNTWSAKIGMPEEATDLIMLNLSNEDIDKYTKQGIKLIKPTEGPKDTHIRFIPECGMDGMCDSTTVDYEGNPFDYSGYLLPHAEIITLGSFLEYKGNAPTVFYCYRPCDEAIKSLDFMRDNNYELPKDGIVVRNKDVISGWDSIGTLLTFKNGDKFWGGTVCGKTDMDRLGFKSNATTIQVGAFMNSAIYWILTHPNKGLVNAEEVNNKDIFEMASKYLGKQYFKLV